MKADISSNRYKKTQYKTEIQKDDDSALLSVCSE